MGNILGMNGDEFGHHPPVAVCTLHLIDQLVELLISVCVGCQ